ncbi:MAG: hypothetical protein KC535_04485 [Nanoarchaeota archaeon]|nr:hypothetical protein [Nanoarchaeota archaeon]
MPEPLSVEFLLKRGYCCGSSCTNCPYLPKYQKGAREVDPFAVGFGSSGSGYVPVAPKKE